jgi:hypothetical protein
MLSVTECRKLLGKKYSKVSDSEITQIRDDCRILVEICFDSYMKNKRKKRVTNCEIKTKNSS